MAKSIQLTADNLNKIRKVDRRLVSHNIEMTEITGGIIFHNTLASSDYGFLKHGTFEPRPNYFAVSLWNKLMKDVCILSSIIHLITAYLLNCQKQPNFTR